MNWDLFFYLYLGLFFAVAPISFYLFHKDKKFEGRGVRNKIAAVVIMASAAIPFPYVCYLRDLGKWQSRSFDGVIVNRRETRRHALIEFTIDDDVHGEVKILDQFGEMKSYTIGDRVKKRKGKEVVQQGE
jgi:hypothetical protein